MKKVVSVALALVLVLASVSALAYGFDPGKGPNQEFKDIVHTKGPINAGGLPQLLTALGYDADTFLAAMVPQFGGYTNVAFGGPAFQMPGGAIDNPLMVNELPDEADLAEDTYYSVDGKVYFSDGTEALPAYATAPTTQADGEASIFVNGEKLTWKAAEEENPAGYYPPAA